MAAQKLLLTLVTAGILGCWSLGGLDGWEIHPKTQASPTSGFYILHDWQNTFSGDSAVPLPALSVSDVMLKTMGILREGARWAGVQMGSLFSRPHATALFVVDGLSQGSSLGSLSDKAFSVDQTGLTGSVGEDMHAMFDGDNVATHMSNLFDGDSQTRSVSANEEAATAGSAAGASSGPEQFASVLKMLCDDPSLLDQYGLNSILDMKVEEDASFLTEMFMIHQTMDQLKELKNYAKDGAPDIYIFTISTLRALEVQYGMGSTKVEVASQLVKDTLEKVTAELVSLYEGKILVQALVLEWDYPDVSESDELLVVYSTVQPFLTSPEWEDFKASLPELHLIPEAAYEPFLCFNLKKAGGTTLRVKCPDMTSWGSHRYVRDIDEENYRGDDSGDIINITIGNAATGRSESYSAIFLIILFLSISLGLAVYAVSWMMWTMDPGRDTIIYRQVSDPTEGMRL